MMEQLQNVETLFLTNYVKVFGERHLMIAQQRFKLGKRLYFHIMESMLKQVTGIFLDIFCIFW